LQAQRHARVALREQNPSENLRMTDTTAPPRPSESWISTDPGIVTWRTFLQAHATVIRRLEADLESEGQLSLADLDVLLQLARAESHRLRMSELADEVLLSRSGMTRRIDRLEASGLVRRHECAADRRGAYAAITETGLERLREARPAHLRGITMHFVSKLTAEDLEAMRAVLAKVIPLDDRPTDKGC
jgi:DNA-binding MarR family transcriptional regulator